MEKPMSELVSKALSSVSQTTPKAFRECCQCGKIVEMGLNDPRRAALDIWCSECDEAILKSISENCALKEKDRIERILSQVPDAFRHTERGKLPNPEKLDEAMRWEFGQSGILLYGPTGCGKSRVAWEIAKREVLAGRKFKCINAFELSRYPSMMMMDGGVAEKFADELVRIDLLMMDDVFKAKPTERVEELLFAVIDERGQWERPCIITLNDTGETLSARLSPDRGPALIRRLRDYCIAIKF
jgi:DNA replication protein DnaC